MVTVSYEHIHIEKYRLFVSICLIPFDVGRLFCCLFAIAMVAGREAFVEMFVAKRR